MDNLKIKLCKDISILLKKDLDLVLANTSVNVFDEPFKLSSEELLYIYFYLKKKYKFKKDDEFLKDEGFLCIDNMIKMIS